MKSGSGDGRMHGSQPKKQWRTEHRGGTRASGGSATADRANDCDLVTSDTTPGMQTHSSQFLVPMDEDVAFVRGLCGGVLIRGPPACGKSTLAYAVRRAAPWNPERSGGPRERTYILLDAAQLGDAITAAEQENHPRPVTAKIHSLLNDADNLNGALDILPFDMFAIVTFLVANNVAVLVDDAHVLLQPGKFKTLMEFFTAFLKSDGLDAVFFTTMGVVTSGVNWVYSPPEISKYFFRGQLPRAAVESSLRDMLHFTAPAAALLWELSGCHRGVLKYLVDWALSAVPGTPERDVDVADLLRALRKDRSDFTSQLHMSRAVTVAGDAHAGFDFLHCLALATFDSSDPHQNVVGEDALVDATTHGFIQPVAQLEPSHSDNFSRYTWLTDKYCVANVFQTDRYASLLAENEIVMEPLPFNSCADVVLEVLPQLRLLDLLPTELGLSCPILAGSHTCMPPEDGWNSELLAKFNAPGNRDATRRRRASPQYSTKKGVGKPDFTWKDTPVGSADKFVYIIESVMWDKDVAKHYDRFRPLPGAVSSSDESQSTDADDTGADDTGAAGTVSEGQVARGKPLKLYHRRKRGETRRALLVIGPDEVAVRNAMNSAASPGDKLFDVDVLGIFPFPGYTAMGFLAAPDAAMAEVPCDNVPRRWCDNAVVVGRKVTSWGHAQNPNAVWVQEQGGDRINIQGLKRPNPPENDIYNLKVAIQDHLGKQGSRNVKRISIFDSVNASSPLPDDTPVMMHTRRAPYMFTVEEGPPPAFADTPPIYVRVYLPGSDKRVTTDVRLRLRSEGLRENVDCLRQILLTIFKLESKGPQHVTVYPQAAKSPMEEAAEALGDVVVITSTLDDTKPYHAVVDGHAPSSS